MQRMVYELTCKWCGNAFAVKTPSEARKRMFCGQECARHGNWKPSPRAPYRMTKLPEGHPLTVGQGRTLGVHKLALWEKIGPGTHPCHYCAVPVTWRARESGARLTVEHLDRDRLNNNPANLVPCCYRCNNLNRSTIVSDDELFRVHASGHRIRGNPAVCQHCGTDYVARRDHKGWFCSRKCSAQGREAKRRAVKARASTRQMSRL